MNKNKIDLPVKTITQLKGIFARWPEIETVVIFGSRVLGNAKQGSDIDCALTGVQLTSKLVDRIQNYLEEETLIPYFFDCIHFDTIANPNLRNHIKVHGVILYDVSESNQSALRISE